MTTISSKKRVLILGGAGYIGSHIVKAYSEDEWKDKYEIGIVDNFSTGHYNAIKNLVYQKFVYQLNINDLEGLKAAIEDFKPDGIIQFAASIEVGESTENPCLYFHNNISGTTSVVEAMHQCGIKNIVFSSTSALYGEPQNEPFKEDTKICPKSVYGFTKQACEYLLNAAEHAYGIKSVRLRYFNACGAHHTGQIGEAHTPETHLIPIVLEVASGKRDHINIYGTNYDTRDGTCIRDYIHVEDLATAHILALNSIMIEKKESNIFNLGTGTGYSVKEIIDAARQVTGKEIKVVEGPRREGDPPKLVADATKAEELLGWKRKYHKVEDIIKTAWNWHNSHPTGFAS